MMDNNKIVKSNIDIELEKLKRDFYSNIDFTNNNILYRKKYVTQYVDKNYKFFETYYHDTYNANINKKIPLSSFDKVSVFLNMVADFLIMSDGYDRHMFLNKNDLK